MSPIPTITGLVLLVGASLPAQAVTDKYAVTPEEHAACDGDAMSLCADALSDQDGLIACMKAKQNRLSPVCFTTLKAGLTRRHMRL